MTALLAYLDAHRKALYGFVTAEAATWIVALQGDVTVKSALIASLTPLAVGASVHKATNT